MPAELIEVRGRRDKRVWSLRTVVVVNLPRPRRCSAGYLAVVGSAARADLAFSGVAPATWAGSGWARLAEHRLQ